MSLGEEKAVQTGLNVKLFRIYVFIIASLVTASAVSFSGIIGFVGLMIPHIARFFVGPNHKILYITSAILGAIFLPLCDILARVTLYPTEIPIGIITSIIGGLFFIFLLKIKTTNYYE
jgi:iron complex transport system permease protein